MVFVIHTDAIELAAVGISQARARSPTAAALSDFEKQLIPALFQSHGDFVLAGGCSLPKTSPDCWFRRPGFCAHAKHFVPPLKLRMAKRRCFG